MDAFRKTGGIAEDCPSDSEDCLAILKIGRNSSLKFVGEEFREDCPSDSENWPYQPENPVFMSSEEMTMVIVQETPSICYFVQLPGESPARPRRFLFVCELHHPLG
jgi:hypothetical protein